MTGIIAGLLLLAGCGSVAASDRSGTYVPPDDPAGNIFVKDIGDVLDKATEQRIYGLNKSWESRKDKPQLLVVTLKSLDGDSIENKATELFDKYKPGEKGKDTGLLYLLSVELQGRRLEQGGQQGGGRHRNQYRGRFPHEIPDGATEEGTGRWHHDRRHAHRVLSRKLHSRVP